MTTFQDGSKERPPFEIQNLHLLKTKRSGATFATSYMNARDPEYMNDP